MGETDQLISQICGEHRHREGALLPVLHGIQDALGFLPPETAGRVAEELNLSRAEVHGVISFYHLFRQHPPGQRTLYICRSEACQAMGNGPLINHVREKLGIDFHQTTGDRRFSLEPIYCLGNCACAPAVMLDDELHGRVTSDRLDELLD